MHMGIESLTLDPIQDRIPQQMGWNPSSHAMHMREKRG